MKDDGQTIVISADGPRGCAVTAFASGSLVGLAMIALFVASVVAPNEGASPVWWLLVVGVPWTLMCVLGVGSTSFVEIDPGRRQVRQIISHLGLRRSVITPFEEILEVGVRREPGRRSPLPYRLLLSTRALVPGTTLTRAIRLHGHADRERLAEDARVIAERIGVPFTRGAYVDASTGRQRHPALASAGRHRRRYARAQQRRRDHRHGGRARERALLAAVLGRRPAPRHRPRSGHWADVSERLRGRHEPAAHRQGARPAAPRLAPDRLGASRGARPGDRGAHHVGDQDVRAGERRLASASVSTGSGGARAVRRRGLRRRAGGLGTTSLRQAWLQRG